MQARVNSRLSSNSDRSTSGCATRRSWRRKDHSAAKPPIVTAHTSRSRWLSSTGRRLRPNSRPKIAAVSSAAPVRSQDCRGAGVPPAAAPPGAAAVRGSAVDTSSEPATASAASGMRVLNSARQS